MKKKIDIVDVMLAVRNGELKASVRGGFCFLENTKSGERVRLNEVEDNLVPHGRWEPYYEDVEIYNTGGFTERKQTGWICGRCKSKKSFTQYYTTDFCPNCGAKMDGRKENG